MLREIINNIIAKLEAGGVTDVYSAFDAKDIASKAKGIFTVVGIGGFESFSPIYSPYTVFIPFKTDIEMNITAPSKTSVTDIYTFYDEKIEPVISDMSGLTCNLSKMSITFDTNIQRLVLTAKLSASGITKTERSSV